MSSPADHFIRRLGKGSYGTVDEVEVAGKRLARKIYLEELCPSAIREVAFLTAVEHPNILRLERIDFTYSRTVVYLELASERLVDLVYRGCSIAVACKVMHGILRGLQVLHQQGLVHGDLNPYNILMVGDVPKLADFGTVQPPRQGARTTTIAWSSPEYLLRNQHSTATDMWSIGLIFYEWLSGVESWSTNEEESELLEKQVKLVGCPDRGSLQLELSCELHTYQPRKLDTLPAKHYTAFNVDKYKKDCDDLINGCLAFDPESRWTVEQALASPLFSNFEQPTTVWHKLEGVSTSSTESQRIFSDDRKARLFTTLMSGVEDPSTDTIEAASYIVRSTYGSSSTCVRGQADEVRRLLALREYHLHL